MISSEYMANFDWLPKQKGTFRSRWYHSDIYQQGIRLIILTLDITRAKAWIESWLLNVLWRLDFTHCWCFLDGALKSHRLGHGDDSFDTNLLHLHPITIHTQIRTLKESEYQNERINEKQWESNVYSLRAFTTTKTLYVNKGSFSEEGPCLY